MHPHTHFPQHLQIEQHWRVSGAHYQRTLEAWLSKMDRLKETILPVLGRAYGEHQSLKWWVQSSSLFDPVVDVY
jgi:cyclopropane-fatty-acyl-phospholipid synthase